MSAKSYIYDILRGQKSVDSVLESILSPRASHVYHVTFLYRLGKIKSAGLVPSATSNYGGGYAAHSRGKIFYTTWEGVPYWFHRLETVAVDATDDFSDGWVPVCLRAEFLAVPDLEADDIGSRDSRHTAFHSISKMPPSKLMMWDGSSWKNLSSIAVDKLVSEWLAAGDEDEYGEVYYDFDYFMPKTK